jgi:hypothetical protein
MFGRYRGYLLCRWSRHLVTALLGVITFWLAGEPEELADDEAGAHQQRRRGAASATRHGIEEPGAVQAGPRRVTAGRAGGFHERRVNCENSGCESGIADLAAVTLVTWR